METPAIQVKGLVKRFEKLTAVDGVDFAVQRGECVGLLGPNGAGKTTTVEMLEGLQQATAGEIRVLGKTWAEAGVELRSRIGIQLQDTLFYEKLKVGETVQLFRSFYPSGLSVSDAIASVQLQEKADVQIRKLSGGQKRRLALAVALAGDPEILFLDEPTTGLDPQARRALWDVIEGLKSRGRTVLITTHYMEEAEKLCDRIAILDHGKVVAEGSPAELIRGIGAEQVIEFTADPVPSNELLAGIPGQIAHGQRNGTSTLAVQQIHVSLPALLETLKKNGHTLSNLTTRHGTLDDVFLAKTGKHLRDDGEGA